MFSLVDRFIHKYGRLPTEVDPDYLEMLRMSKYRILAIPDFKPGKCANCGSSKKDGRNYLDFGLEVDWYGIVYICSECLKDIAREMGLFKEFQEQILNLEVKLAHQSNIEDQGKDLHEIVVNSFKELENYYDRIYLHTAGNHTSSDSTSSVVTDEVSDESVVNAPEPESDVNAPESRTAEPTASSRRKNVRSLAELLGNTKD